jgi:hypothetical protein
MDLATSLRWTMLDHVRPDLGPPSWPSRPTSGAEGRRYLGLEVLARCRVNIVATNDPEIGADHLPALTAEQPPSKEPQRYTTTR